MEAGSDEGVDHRSVCGTRELATTRGPALRRGDKQGLAVPMEFCAAAVTRKCVVSSEKVQS